MKCRCGANHPATHQGGAHPDVLHEAHDQRGAVPRGDVHQGGVTIVGLSRPVFPTSAARCWSSWGAWRAVSRRSTGRPHNTRCSSSTRGATACPASRAGSTAAGAASPATAAVGGGQQRVRRWQGRWRRRWRAGVCFNCGQEGHWARDCPNKKGGGTGGRNCRCEGYGEGWCGGGGG